MLFYLLLIATSPFLSTAFPQNSDNGPMEIARADGFVFDGPASNGQNSTSTTSTSTTSTSSTLTSTIPVSTISPDEFNNCIVACPVTNEYNPVCGTDNVNYTNPGGLGCAQRCGKDVILNYYGRCPTG